MRRVRLSLAFAWMLAAFTSPGFGQAIDGSLVGTVVDASGAAVPNVMVALENMATGVKASTKTNCSNSIGKPLPIAPRTLEREPLEVVFI